MRVCVMPMRKTGLGCVGAGLTNDYEAIVAGVYASGVETRCHPMEVDVGKNLVGC